MTHAPPWACLRLAWATSLTSTGEDVVMEGGMGCPPYPCMASPLWSCRVPHLSVELWCAGGLRPLGWGVTAAAGRLTGAIMMGERLPAGWSWEDITTTALQVSEAGLAPVRLLCYTIYQCWRSRNAYTHGRVVGTPVVIAAAVLENIAIFDQGRNSGCWGTSRPSGLFRLPTWCPPTPTARLDQD
ncbi:hypothetical protein KSP40_PGU010463 [Platanthera guangdongensis]|uniref:Uncharacterized protein n=1 Tax=Platanthera guangdongensis TaxID=2320717 RepID=A0ABR2LZD0_9ASPA